MLSRSHTPALALGAFVALNTLLVVWRILASASLLPPAWTTMFGSASQSEYSYIGNDYPMHFPIPAMEPVAMSLHETAHFSMEVNDMIGNDEWSSIRNATTGLGRVRLGPEHRLFIVSYFHEMHCLLELQHGMLYPGTYPEVWGTPEKVRYCINYLRQMFLCSASDMLEKGDFLASTFEAGTVGDDLVCQDWPVLLGEMQQNYDEYLDWYREWN